MNGEAWDILVARLRDSAQRPTADQLRLLAAVQEQVTAEIVDILNIAADGIELDETDDAADDAADEGTTQA